MFRCSSSNVGGDQCIVDSSRKFDSRSEPSPCEVGSNSERAGSGADAFAGAGAVTASNGGAVGGLDPDVAS